MGGSPTDGSLLVDTRDIENGGEFQTFSVTLEAGSDSGVQGLNESFSRGEGRSDGKDGGGLLQESGNETDDVGSGGGVNTGDDGGGISQVVLFVETVEDLLEDSSVGIVGGGEEGEELRNELVNDLVSKTSDVLTQLVVLGRLELLVNLSEFVGESREMGGGESGDLSNGDTGDVVISQEGNEFGVTNKASSNLGVQGLDEVGGISDSTREG